MRILKNLLLFLYGSFITSCIWLIVVFWTSPNNIWLIVPALVGGVSLFVGAISFAADITEHWNDE